VIELEGDVQSSVLGDMIEFGTFEVMGSVCESGLATDERFCLPEVVFLIPTINISCPKQLKSKKIIFDWGKFC
jgi:hypothetical protein